MGFLLVVTFKGTIEKAAGCLNLLVDPVGIIGLHYDCASCCSEVDAILATKMNP